MVSNIADHETRIAALATSAVPSGAIMAFNLTSCPTGWTEYTAARGRFLRWLDTVGGNDPDCATRTGWCAVGSTQADELKNHTHNLPSFINIMAGASGTAINPLYRSGIETTTATGGTETRPKNVMVLFCSKN